MPFLHPSVSASPTQPSNWLHHLWLFCICAGMLVFFTQVTTLFPVLPLYLLHRYPNAPVGFVVGAMAVGLLCFRPLIGWLLDRWGRKHVLLLGLGIMLIILPLYAWSPNVKWLVITRILHGISQAAFATASQTLLVDLVPPHRRTAMLGYLGMSNTMGFSLGPLLGSLIFHHISFMGVIGLQAGLTLLGILLTLPLPWFTSATASPSSRTLPSPFPWSVILRFPVRDATLMFFTGSFLHGAVVTFLPLLVPKAALFYSLNALVAVLVRFALGRRGHQVSQRWVLSLGLLCSGTGLVGLALAPHWLVLWSMVYGMGFGILFPVLSAIVSLAAPAASRGRVYGVFLAGFDGGMTLGGAGVQPFVGMFPLSALFLMLGGVGWGASLVAFRQFAQPLPPNGRTFP